MNTRTRESIRYAVVGCGMMGQEHLRNLALLRTRRGWDLSISALVEPDSQMLDSTLALLAELELGQPKVLASHLDISAELCDVVLLVSPNFTHYDLLKDLLHLDVAILAEKPLCVTVAQCQEIERLCQDKSNPVWVAMEYRYMPPTRRFIEEIENGFVGQLRSLSIREHRFPFLSKVGDWNRFSRNTGGTLVEKCCHHFDLMRLIIGCEAVRVYASGAMDVNHLDEQYDGEVPDILDNAMVLVDFENGVRASLDLCMFADGSNPQEQLTAIGDRAKLQANIPGAGRFWKGQESPATLQFQPRNRELRQEVVEVDEALALAGDHHGSTYYQHEKFAQAVLHGAEVEVKVSDGAKAVQLGAAAQQSLTTGQVVLL
ncbi:MAG: Gfo/Idh/MocA family oxidoreductase [Gammaproteobacteria bacterium]|nr:Gfo/Idh/MocA family oxidoreductase [Gammaproteobacteria bacterium]